MAATAAIPRAAGTDRRGQFKHAAIRAHRPQDNVCVFGKGIGHPPGHRPKVMRGLMKNGKNAERRLIDHNRVRLNEGRVRQGNRDAAGVVL